MPGGVRLYLWVWVGVGLQLIFHANQRADVTQCLSTPISQNREPQESNDSQKCSFTKFANLSPSPARSRDTSVCAELVAGVKALDLRPAILMRDVLEQEVSKVLGKAQEEFCFLNSLRGSDLILFLLPSVSPWWIKLDHKKGAQSSVRFVFETTFTHTLTKPPYTLTALWMLFYTLMDVSTPPLAGCVPCPPLLLPASNQVHPPGGKTAHITAGIQGVVREGCEITTEAVLIKKLRNKGSVLIVKVYPLQSSTGMSISISDLLLSPEDF